MRKICVFLIICCVGAVDALFGQTHHRDAYVCEGSTYTWELSGFCESLDTVIYASGPDDWTVFYDNAQYDTAVGNAIVLFPTENRLYRVVSINGEAPDCPILLSLRMKTVPKFIIDSVKHVTCPDGWDIPYHDGEVFWHLTDSVWEYAWTPYGNFAGGGSAGVDDSLGIFFHAYGQRSGTYQIEAHGMNGCVYRDSVLIEQPDPWVDLGCLIDTVCSGQTGCIQLELYGGTPPYSFTWFYLEQVEDDIDTIFLEDTTRLACGLEAGGKIYLTYMYDSRGCKFLGEEIEFIFSYLYEYVEDSTHIITTNPITCYGSPFLAHAQSMGYGSYTWYVGDVVDSVNYSTWVEADAVLIAEYHTPPMTESAWVSVDFADQHGCVTHDSVWVEVSHPEVNLVNTPDNLCSNGDYPLDLAAYTATNPAGGTLYYYGAAGLSWNGQFTPASAGSYEIHAIYTDPDGCTGQDSTTIHVMDPEPIVLTVDSLMFTDSLYHIQAPAGGTMLLDGTVLTETSEGYVVDANQYEPGYYTLHYEVIIGEYDCLSEYETVIHFINSTKVRDFDQEISIYPNPATTTLNLSSTETMDFTATITDITGKVIRTERILSTRHAINVSDLSSGIYLLRLQTPSGPTKTVKFVKR